MRKVEIFPAPVSSGTSEACVREKGDPKSQSRLLFFFVPFCGRKCSTQRISIKYSPLSRRLPSSHPPPWPSISRLLPERQPPTMAGSQPLWSSPASWLAWEASSSATTSGSQVSNPFVGQPRVSFSSFNSVLLVGGVTSMESFLEKFFPDVYAKMRGDSAVSNYCKFNSQLLTAFTSSLYVAGLFATFIASWVTRRFGRRRTMQAGGFAFMAGAALGGAAADIYMVIFGRVLLGIGVGLANQVRIPNLLFSEAPCLICNEVHSERTLKISICWRRFNDLLEAVPNGGLQDCKNGVWRRLNIRETATSHHL